MLGQKYSWKRLWHPIDRRVNLTDNSYLYNSESKWGKIYNHNLVNFEDISKTPCLVLLGEAGIGKTTALREAYQLASAETSKFKQTCLWFNLGDYETDRDLCEAIFQNKTFQEWICGTHSLHLFLDSLDEGLLSIKILVRILKRELDKIPKLPCSCLYFRITCRTAEWSDDLEKKLKERWKENHVGIYELVPLQEIDIIEAAIKNNLVYQDFLQDIYKRGIFPLATKPVTLDFLVTLHNLKNEKFPHSQEDLYKQGCLQLCEEVNPDRRSSGFLGKLNANQRLILVSRIAALIIFANRIAILTSPLYRDRRDSDFQHPFETLGDAIIVKAWEYFYLTKISEYFTKVTLIQWREYQKIITRDSVLENKFQTSLINDTNKRRKLIEQAVVEVIASGEETGFLVSGLTDYIIQSEDIIWMLGKLKNVDSQEERIWSNIIQWSFNRQDAKQIDAILTVTQTNNILREEFASYFTAIDLNSEQAEILKAEYEKRQERAKARQNSLLNPSPKERIILLLDQLDIGNLSAWWQLNREMCLKPDSRFYENEFESDLTKLPGWEEADLKTRKRIIKGAEKYIQESIQVAYDWIGKNKFNRAALAGCRALQLLLKETPEFLEALSSEVWQRWASVIVGFPSNSQREEGYTELVKLAYINAPTETLNTLLLIIDKENKEHDSIFILHKFEKCWDERFKAAVLEKAKHTAIKPKCLSQLLEELLKHESIEARKFAQSLVSIPLPLEEDAHQKAVFAAKELVGCAEPMSWEIVWSAIQQDTNFGREVFEAISNRYSHGVHLPITEKQLADLYIWLVQQYPHAEDPRHDGVYWVGVRESIAGFRDNVLTQLRETGTSQACTEIERISEQFPELTWLKRTLLNAQKVKRRKNWQPLPPEQILQIITKKDIPSMKTILFLAANPKNSTPLRLDEEVREIHESLRRSNKRDQFNKLEQRWAVRTSDLRRALLDTEPQIVHFCGHGAGNQGLVIEDENGQSKLLSTEALVKTFKLCAEHVECVLLNACYSEVQAEVIVEHIDYVIGMNERLFIK